MVHAQPEPPYAPTTSSVGNDFVVLFAGRVWVRQQLPLTISPDSEPEPDIAVVRIDQNRYRDRHPAPEDVYLLIEVPDSTLSYDCDRKAKVYAKASIPEYWIVDVRQQRLLVFREPQGDVYQTEQAFDLAATIAPVASPEIAIDLSKVFL